jgi:hypothetical protein
MYIKIKEQDILDGNINVTIDTELETILHKYNLIGNAGDFLGDNLVNYLIEDYRYFYLRFYDLPNKNRLYLPTKEEEEDILNYVKSKGLELVTELPENY